MTKDIGERIRERLQECPKGLVMVTIKFTKDGTYLRIDFLNKKWETLEEHKKLKEEKILRKVYDVIWEVLRLKKRFLMTAHVQNE